MLFIQELYSDWFRSFSEDGFFSTLYYKDLSFWKDNPKPITLKHIPYMPLDTEYVLGDEIYRLAIAFVDGSPIICFDGDTLLTDIVSVDKSFAYCIDVLEFLTSYAIEHKN